MEPYIDTHVHTHHSAWDCTCPMDLYLDRIREGFVSAIGFADHYHPFMEIEPEMEERRNSPLLFNCDRYAKDIRAAKEEGLNVYMGLEVTHDYNQDINTHAMAELKRQDYDYVIGSIHRVGPVAVSRGDYQKDVVDAAHMANVINQYYDGILDILRFPQYTVIGHIDIYKRPLKKDHPLVAKNLGLIAERTEEVAKAVAHSGKIVEINTSSFTRAYGDFLPNRDFLSRFIAYGGERICFASDAHDVARLNGNFTQATDFVLSLGLEYIFYPWEGGKATKL